MMSEKKERDEEAPVEGEPSAEEGASGDKKSKDDKPKVDEPAAAVLRLNEDDMTQLEKDIVANLKTVYDPEIPVDVYELGLIYDFSCDATGRAQVKMTLTSPMCPVAGTLPLEVQGKVQDVEGVNHCEVDLVFDPPWNPAQMTDAARLALNMGGMNL
jgi:FeS assembly SUF system protein